MKRAAALCLELLLCVMGCRMAQSKIETGAPDIRPIDAIYVKHRTMMPARTDYKIDLANGTLWEIAPWPYINQTPWELPAEHEIFSFACDLPPERVDEFRRQSARHGLTHWEGQYENRMATDGHEWSVTLCFSDGSRKTSSGYNAYPKGWEKVKADFKALTGVDIL